MNLLEAKILTRKELFELTKKYFGCYEAKSFDEIKCIDVDDDIVRLFSTAILQKSDLSFHRFEKLIGIEPINTQQTKFLCDCGKEIILYNRHVKNGQNISCGCEGRRKSRKVFHSIFKPKEINPYK